MTLGGGLVGQVPQCSGSFVSMSRDQMLFELLLAGKL
jgi:hypothetical protein